MSRLQISTTERQAYDLMTEGFGVGYNGPLLIAASTLDPVAAPSAEYTKKYDRATALQKELKREQRRLQAQADALKQRQAELEREQAQLERKASVLQQRKAQLEQEEAGLRAQEARLRAEAERLVRQAASIAAPPGRDPWDASGSSSTRSTRRPIPTGCNGSALASPGSRTRRRPPVRGSRPTARGPHR